PARLVRSDVPPTLVFVAANDHLVRPVRSTSTVDALRAAGADVELIVVPFADHGFDGAPNAFGEQLEEQVIPAFIEGLPGEGLPWAGGAGSGGGRGGADVGGAGPSPSRRIGRSRSRYDSDATTNAAGSPTLPSNASRSTCHRYSP